MKRARTGAATRSRHREEAASYTGLPADYLLKADLRVIGPEFEQQLLLDTDQTTGRFDTRFAGPVIDPLSE